MNFAGDSLTIEIDLVDGLTAAPIAASEISKAWVRIGAIALTTPTAKLVLTANLLRVSLTAEDTAPLRGAVAVVAKVLTTSGDVSTIAEQTLTFSPHNLTSVYA